MDLMTYRVLDTLARSLGESLSMRALAARIEDVHGTGAYPNVHAALQALQTQGWIRLEDAGRSRIVRLDVRASRHALAERDLRRYQEFRAAFPRMCGALDDLHEAFFRSGASGFLVDPERGAKTNRIHIIATLDDPPERLLGDVHAIARRHNTPIDVAPLAGLPDAIRLDEWTPVSGWIRSGFAFHHPQHIWYRLADVKAWPTPQDTPGLDDVETSLAILGYRGLGTRHQKKRICVEEAATQLIAAKTPRRLAAAAVILAKNPADPGLLHCLALRRGIASEALALIRINATPSMDAAARLFEASHVEDASIDEAHIRSTMAQYA